MGAEDLINAYNNEENAFDGKYVLEEIASEKGAFKYVFKARHKHIPREVALLVYRQHYEIDKNKAAYEIDKKEGNKIFLDEIKKLSEARGLSTVAEVIDGNVIELNGQLIRYIVEDWVDGVPMAEIIEKHKEQDKPISLKDIVEYGISISECFHDLHKRNLCHLDASKNNIMITSKSRAKLVDLGTARTIEADHPSRTGGILVSAPEQFNGKGDKESDIWALGIALYEMINLEHPFATKEDLRDLKSDDKDLELAARERVKNKILNEDPHPIERVISSELANVVYTALSKAPSERKEAIDKLIRYQNRVEDFFVVNDLEKRVRVLPENKKRLGSYRKLLQLIGKAEIDEALSENEIPNSLMNFMRNHYHDIGDFIINQRDAWPTTGFRSELFNDKSLADDRFYDLVKWNYLYMFALNIAEDFVSSRAKYRKGYWMNVLDDIHRGKEHLTAQFKEVTNYAESIGIDKPYSRSLMRIFEILNEINISPRERDYSERERDKIGDSFVYNELVKIVAEGWLSEYNNGWNGIEDWTGKAGFPIGRIVLNASCRRILSELDQNLHDHAAADILLARQGNGYEPGPGDLMAFHPADLPGETRTREEIDENNKKYFKEFTGLAFRTQEFLDEECDKILSDLRYFTDIEKLFKTLAPRVEVSKDSVGKALTGMYEDLEKIREAGRKRLEEEFEGGLDFDKVSEFYSMLDDELMQIILDSARMQYVLADLHEEKETALGILDEGVENLDFLLREEGLRWHIKKETGNVVYSHTDDMDGENSYRVPECIRNIGCRRAFNYLKNMLLMKKADILYENGESHDAFMLLLDLRDVISIEQETDIRLREAEIKAEGYIKVGEIKEAMESFKEAYNSERKSHRGFNNELPPSAASRVIDYELVIRPKLVKKFLEMFDPEEKSMHYLYALIKG
ncbi:protein kinase [Candidatus Woesearchaeota archaeon]|nr:protein kinase [Candidatus Woesearchaeota archaeon]